MDQRIIYQLDIIHAKVGYIIASLSSYASLDLSKRLVDINKHIELIKKSFLENKEYVDIRDVIELREFINKNYKNSEEEGPNEGHKIACLLYEAHTYIKMLCLDIEGFEDIVEYLQYSSIYMNVCAKIINEQILCY